MELRELKKTWKKMGSTRELDEHQINEMFQKRATSLIEKIDRNIKIGFVILFLLIALFILDDFVFSPLLSQMAGQPQEVPRWLLFMSLFSNLFFLTTFIYFSIRYSIIKKRCDIACDLKEVLMRIIRILRIYQRLFYLALTILSVAIAIAFVTGMVMGMSESAGEQGMMLEDLPARTIALALVTGLVVLGVIVGGLFLLMRWGFRRLYGNYIHRLKQMLHELEENGE